MAEVYVFQKTENNIRKMRKLYKIKQGKKEIIV